MSIKSPHKLVISISSSALFDLNISNEVFEKQGVNDYAKYQIAHENDLLQPGAAFHLVHKLLELNQKHDLVEVILLSRNSADTGLRVFNSIEHYNLNITRAAFTSGKSPYEYVKAFEAHLFLSTNPNDVCHALNEGCAAATIISKQHWGNDNKDKLVRIAFDADAVIFSGESEKIFQHKGLQAFTQYEIENENHPMNAGPFKGFLAALHKLQQYFPENDCPIRTALVTARQAPTHKRVIQTLRSWNIRIDEAIFLGGLEKGNFLNAFKADLYFDDQWRHCASAAQHVTTGHVPNESINPSKTKEGL